MNQIEVQIMGQSYLLSCPVDGETQLREAVARVDAAMSGIRDAGKVKARDRIAVLVSLNLSFDLVQREHDLAAAREAAEAAQAALASAEAACRLAEEARQAAEAARDAALAAAPAPTPSSRPASPTSPTSLLSYSSTVASSPDPRTAQLMKRLEDVLSRDSKLL